MNGPIDQHVTAPKHDVAISLLKEDLALASELSLKLAPLSTFLYSEEQEQLAGTDALASFREAFISESRLNVILHRRGWGETPYTRVEEMAIQERCLRDGWETLLLVKLDDATTPLWVPRSTIYLDLRAYPVDQAVGAIKRQVQNLGGDVRPASQADLVRARVREAEFAKETMALFRTPEGVRAADEAVARIVQQLTDELASIATEGDRRWEIKGGFDNNYGVVRFNRCSALFNWQRYANDCNRCQLSVRVFNASFETPAERAEGRHYLRFGEHEAHKFHKTFQVTRTPPLGVAWTQGGNVFSCAQVAHWTLDKLTSIAFPRD